MERIILEADEKVAKAWRNTPSTVRSKIEKSLEQQISHILNQTKAANFERLLAEVRSEATANGLTEDILRELLEEYD